MIGLIIGMMIVTMLLPSLAATPTVGTKKEVFTQCYIKATGAIEFTWKLNDIPIGLRYRFISYWPIVFNEPNVDVTIYSKKNGDILWEDTIQSGQWVLYLVGFLGKYNNEGSSADTLIANLDGKACFVMLSTEGDTKSDATDQGFHRSVSSSVSIDDIPSITTQERYMNCYLEISGYMHNDWPAFVKFPNMVQIGWRSQLNSDKVLFGAYSYILFEKDVTIKVYDKQDGDLLWQHEGVIDPLITLLGFSGEYILDDTPYELPHITLTGTAGFLGVILKDFPDP